MPRTGRPKLPQAKGERIVIRLTKQELEKVKKYTDEKKLTVSQLIRERIADILSV